MQDPLATWKSEYKNIDQSPPTALQGAQNFASWIDARVTNKLTLGPPFVGTATFTWQPSVFAPLIVLPPSPDPVSPRTAMASAWQTATLAATMVVAPGAFIGVSSPATLFSAPPLCVIDPPTLATAFSTLLAGLLALPLAPDINLVQIPDLFNAAFAALTFTLTGLNSVSPPVGPEPLIDPLNPVL